MSPNFLPLIAPNIHRIVSPFVMDELPETHMRVSLSALNMVKYFRDVSLCLIYLLFMFSS
jgi:F0F1-type ATP synthase beta subunit